MFLAFLLASDFWLPDSGFAATNVFLRNISSQLGAPPSGWSLRTTATTNGSAKQTLVTNSITGPLTGHYFPISTANYIVTSSAGGSNRMFITPPLSSAVTVSGTITPNIWGLESNGQCNCGLRYEVLRWGVSVGGIVSSLGISAGDGLTEWGTSAAVRTSPTLSPASTNFAAGDRIVIILYNDDASGVTEASGRTFTINFDAATGVDGDTYLSFTESLTFASDTNNGRAMPSYSLLRPLLHGWKEYFDEVFG